MNKDIKLQAMAAGVKLWQIADALNMTDSHFSRILRKELSDEKKKEVFSIIEQLSGQGAKEQ